MREEWTRTNGQDSMHGVRRRTTLHEIFLLAVIKQRCQDESAPAEWVHPPAGVPCVRAQLGRIRRAVRLHQQNTTYRGENWHLQGPAATCEYYLVYLSCFVVAISPLITPPFGCCWWGRRQSCVWDSLQHGGLRLWSCHWAEARTLGCSDSVWWTVRHWTPRTLPSPYFCPNITVSTSFLIKASETLIKLDSLWIRCLRERTVISFLDSRARKWLWTVFNGKALWNKYNFPLLLFFLLLFI